jgi:hypothetical protein
MSEFASETGKIARVYNSVTFISPYFSPHHLFPASNFFGRVYINIRPWIITDEDPNKVFFLKIQKQTAEPIQKLLYLHI